MKLELFIKSFAAEFDETPIEKFSADTVFKDLDEWSSLTALSIIAMVDEEFEVLLTGNDMRKSTKIVDLYDLITSKLT